MPSLSEKLKAFYSRQDTIPKLIEDISVPTQKLDEYYIKLNMLANEGSGDKYPIETEEMFALKNGKAAADKVLVFGGAGIGKSVFLQNIAYKWSKGELFNNKFDSSFKIRLKLLSNDWKAGFNSDDLDEPLKCLILYSLKSEPIYTDLCKESKDFKITKEEVFDTIDSTNNHRILLLLDGYDEVAAEIASGSDHIKTKIREEIFGFKYVMMTSRPNALDFRIEMKFDRKVESLGLNTNSMYEYISKYFSKQSEPIIEKSKTIIEKNAARNDKTNFLESKARTKLLKVLQKILSNQNSCFLSFITYIYDYCSIKLKSFILNIPAISIISNISAAFSLFALSINFQLYAGGIGMLRIKNTLGYCGNCFCD
jgi:hypothetical protein